MRIKKFMAGFIFAASFLPNLAFAHGQLWYQVSANVPKFKKVVIYPLSNVGSENFLMNENEQSDEYKMNSFIDKRFVRKLKIRTIPLGCPLDENMKIRTDAEKYAPLYQKFSTEAERGAAVGNITAADGYLVPKFRCDEVEQHISPATWVNVQMHDWWEENNGPRGNFVFNESRWVQRHLVPERMMYLRHMDIEQTMYNDKGEKILTYANNEHVYNGRRDGMFKDLVDEFRKDYQDMQKNIKKEKPNSKSGIRIGFKEIKLPSAVGNDEYGIKAAYFFMKNELNRVKNVTADYSGTSPLPNKYFVRGEINYCNLDRTWIPPSAYTTDRIVESQSFKWVDQYGNEQTGHRYHYCTEINNSFGHWAYSAHIIGTFYLVDAASGRVVVSHSGQETDDKVADAYLHLLKDFYKKVDNYINRK